MSTRIAPLPPDTLDAAQRAFHERSVKFIQKSGFDVFKTQDDRGALLGPWEVLIHAPKVGEAHFDEIEAIGAGKDLPEKAKQIAILVVGARYRAAYEIYAHAAVATHGGVSAETVATLVAGRRPPNLSREEYVAYDAASALADGGVLPGPTFAAARDLFGEKGVRELIFWVAKYAQISVILNAYNVAVPVPE